MVFIEDEPVALSTSCTITMTANTIDAASKDDGIWDTALPETLSWEVKNESFDIDPTDTTGEGRAFAYLLNAWRNRTRVEVICGIAGNRSDSGLPTGGWTPIDHGSDEVTGEAYITSLERTGAKGEKAKVTLTLKGVGPLI